MAEDGRTDATVGFVGIGQTGYPMARNGLQAGFDVVATDPDDESVASFDADGGRNADSSAVVATAAHAIHAMVVDDEQVEAVAAHDDGIFDRFEERGDDGELTLMVGGNEAVLAADTPVLEAKSIGILR